MAVRGDDETPAPPAAAPMTPSQVADKSTIDVEAKEKTKL